MNMPYTKNLSVQYFPHLAELPLQPAPHDWMLRNIARRAYIMGYLEHCTAKLFSRRTGILTCTPTLRMIHYHNGIGYDHGIVGYRSVTQNGVSFLIDVWHSAATLSNLMYHGCGLSNTAESISDTALGSECTTATHIDTTKCNPTSYRPYQTPTETDTYTIHCTSTIGFKGGPWTIYEHGLFSAASAGTLWDRTVFAAKVVNAGDTIVFAYDWSLNRGG